MRKKHNFHMKSMMMMIVFFCMFSACINEWLRNHSNCAYCRTAVVVEMFQTTSRRRHRTRPRRNILRDSIVEQSQP